MAIVVPVISTFNPTGINSAITQIASAQTRLDKMAAIGASMSAAGRMMTLGFTAPIAAIGVVSVKAAAEFDRSMNQIQALGNLDPTSKSFADAKAEIIKWGLQTQYSSQDAADAFIALQKAGVETADVTGGVLGAALGLAATEGMDLAYASNIMAQAMNAYGLDAGDAGKVTDFLAQGAIKSTASVEDLAYGLKYVSSTASAMGLSVDETVAALGALNNAGLTASTAGTSLNQMLSGLVAPTKAGAAEMKRLGFSALDSSGELKSMDQIVNDLRTATEGLSGPEKAAALKAMFNTRGMRAANILLKDGANGYDELAAAMGDAEGAAKLLSDARMDSFAGTLEKLRGAAETAAIAFGTALQPAVEWVAEGLTKVATAFTNLSPRMQTVIAVFAVLVAVVGPILLILGMIVSSVATLIPVFVAIAGVIGVTAGALLGWIVVAAAVVAAIVAVAVLIYMNWDKIAAFFKDVWNKIVRTVTEALAKFKDAFPETFGAIAGFIRVAVAFWTTFFTTAWKTIVAIFTMYLNTIKVYFSAAFDAIKGALTAAFTIMWAIISSAFKVWMTGIETALGVVKAIFRGDFDEAGRIVKSGIGDIASIFKSLPGKVLSALGDLGRVLFNAGRELIGGMIDGVKSMISTLKNLVSSAVGLKASAAAPTSASRLVSSSRGRFAAQSVVIHIDGARDPYATARAVKRAIEGYDVSQGRTPGEKIAVAW